MQRRGGGKREEEKRGEQGRGGRRPSQGHLRGPFPRVSYSFSLVPTRSTSPAAPGSRSQPLRTPPCATRHLGQWEGPPPTMLWLLQREPETRTEVLSQPFEMAGLFPLPFPLCLDHI